MSEGAFIHPRIAELLGIEQAEPSPAEQSARPPDDRLAEFLAVCRGSGCEHFNGKVCDWISEETGRPCWMVYTQRLVGRYLPPAEVCELRRRVDRGEFDGPSKTSGNGLEGRLQEALNGR